MIEAQNLGKNYGVLQAVKGAGFVVNKGEIVGLLGPNAAGKTTIMRMLTCYLSPTSGTAKVAEYDILEQPLEVKKRVGYLPENPPLYNELSVQDYVSFVAQIKGVPKKEVKKRTDETLERTNITNVRNRLVGNISRGYRQRVGIAQAIVHNPDVLILDEPTVGLDPKQIIEIRELIQKLAGEHTVLLSTHILSEAQTVCQRVMIIHQGEIVAIDTPDNLQARVKRSEKVFVQIKGADAGQVRQAFEKIDGVRRVVVSDSSGSVLPCEVESEKDVRENLFKAVVSKNWTLLEMRAEILSLEDVFLKLTSEDLPGSSA